MTKQEYQAKRTSLINEAQQLVDAGKLEEFKAKKQEIESLDDQFDAEAKATAELEALNKQPVIDLQNLSTPVTGEVTDQLNFEVKNKETGATNSSEEYLKAWAKSMQGYKLTDKEQETIRLVNAYTHTTDNTGIVIPETVAKGIFRIAAEMYPLYGDIVATNVKGNVTYIVEDTSSDSAWYTESTPTEDGKETLREVNLSGCELARQVKISWKLRAMSTSDFIPYITQKMGEKMGAGLAYGVAHGKGSGEAKPEPTGIITVLEKEGSTPHITTYTAGALTYQNIVTARSKVKGKYTPGLTTYANSTTIWTEIANILDKNGRPIFMADAITNGGVGRMLGITVKEDDSLNDGEILFGNTRGYGFNINEQTSIRQFEDPDNRLTKFVGYAIADGNVLDANAFSLLKKA